MEPGQKGFGPLTEKRVFQFHAKFHRRLERMAYLKKLQLLEHFSINWHQIWGRKAN